MHLRHIVVAADDSAAGRSAVRTGLDLAARAGARLTVMRVVTAVGAREGPDAPGAALERLEQWLAAELAGRPGVAPGLGIAFGLPGIEICRFAEQRGADLLVLGRKHRSTVARFLVERGMPLYELTPVEQTLESFYLGLMKGTQPERPRA